MSYKQPSDLEKLEKLFEKILDRAIETNPETLVIQITQGSVFAFPKKILSHILMKVTLK